MKKLAYLLTSLLGVFALIPTGANANSATQAVQNTTPKAKGVWIDVRSAEEFQQGHLEGSINIPFDQIAEKISHVSPNKDEPINLYCRSGRRAETALQTLKQMGYSNVVNHGGYKDLLAKGYR